MIPISIGRDSSGDLQQINIEDVPILFISYFSEKHLTSIYLQLSSITNNYIIATSKRLVNWGFDIKSNHVFLRDNPRIGNIKSRVDLINLVSKTILIRKRILKKFQATDFKDYMSLSDLRKDNLDHQFLIIDDIWDLVISKPKQLALILMMVILEGPTVGIHSIIGSSLSYRNLLEQIITTHPSLTKELEKKYGNPPPRRIDELSEELIFTAEDLIYFKRSKSLDLQKLYKI
jgi:hypothetical protein